MCLGQQLRSGRAYWVLRRDDDERIRDGMRLAVDCYLTFLHDLQQCRLRLAGGAVDFVRQQQIAHDRAGLEQQAAALLVVNGKTDDVRRNHVRGELNTAIVDTHRAAERQRQRGFAHARHVLQQNVAAGQNRHQRARQHVVLADDSLFDFTEYSFGLRMHNPVVLSARRLTIDDRNCSPRRRKRNRRCPCRRPA